MEDGSGIPHGTSGELTRVEGLPICTTGCYWEGWSYYGMLDG